MGGQTPLPAVQKFSSFAAVSVSFLYLMVVTFFLSCVALSEEAKLRRHGQPTEPPRVEKALCWVSHTIGKVIMAVPVRIAVIGVSVAVATVSALQIPQLKTGLPLSDLAREGSLVDRVESISAGIFGAMRGPRVNVCFDNIPLFQPWAQNQMARLFSC